MKTNSTVTINRQQTVHYQNLNALLNKMDIHITETINTPMEIFKNFGGNSSSPILSARKRQTSTFHCISRGISERSFSLALESVHIHFLEG